MTTELQQIAKRIAARAVLERADRARQKVLIRERITEGRTWDEVQAEASVSRRTILVATQGAPNPAQNGVSSDQPSPAPAVAH